MTHATDAPYDAPASPTVRVLCIPANALLPMRLRTIRRGIGAYQETIGGGWLEVLALSAEATMYLDEDGKGRGLGVNLRATLIAEHALPGFALHDLIAGDVFVVGPVDAEGFDTDLAEDWHTRGFPVKAQQALHVEVG